MDDAGFQGFIKEEQQYMYHYLRLLFAIKKIVFLLVFDLYLST